MEMQVTAPADGTVIELRCAEGRGVSTGQTLAIFRPELWWSSPSISAARAIGLHGIAHRTCLFPDHDGCICWTKGQKSTNYVRGDKEMSAFDLARFLHSCSSIEMGV
jgi:hypothetical protein